MTEVLDILMIEDNEDDAELVSRELRKAGLGARLHLVQTAQQVREALSQRRWDVILCDFSLPGFSGADALRLVRERDGHVPFIFVSGTIGEAAAVTAMRSGAQDYVLKGDLARLMPAVERELREAQLRADRERAEALLRASEERLRRIYDADIFGICAWDENGTIVDANDYFLRLLGYERVDLESGRIRWRELTPAEHMERDLRAGRQLLKVGRCTPYEKEFFHAEGHRVPVVITAAVRDDMPRRGSAMVVDMSSRRRAESEAEEASRLVSAMLLTTPLPIVLLDADGSIRLWNAAAEQVFGWSASEVVGKRLPFTARGADGTAFDVDELYLKGRPLRGVELVSATEDGSPLLVELHCGPIVDAHGKARGVALVFRDLTASRATEEALRHMQRVQSIGLLAGGIAHDFNNLLTIIASSIELALEELPSDAPCHAELQTARDAAQRGAGLTRQLLNFRRQQIPARMPIDLNAVIAPLQQMLQRSLGNPDIRVEIDLAPKLGTVRADAGQVEQVLLNLAVNARDAMPAGGVLAISTCDTRIPASTFGDPAAAGLVDAVGVRVRDTGCGMSEETMARIFERFFTTKAPGHGTGLGLSTVQEIMRVHGGAVQLESAVGSGTTFTLLFPHAEKGTVAPLTAEHRIIRLPVNTKILLVDDEPIIRRVTKLLLERLGGQVTAMHSGEAALAYLKSAVQPPALLITDVSMPEMSGFDLAAAVREHHPSIPVLYVSGYSDDERIESELQRGDCRFLQKPFRTEEVVLAVMELLQH